MQGTDILLSTATIGITLAGFIGIVATLGFRSQGQWEPHDQLRLGIMLASSLGSALFSYLPIVIHDFGVSPCASWSISSAMLATGLLILWACVMVARRRLPRSSRAEFSWRIGIPIQLTIIVVFILLVRNALAFAREGSSAPYFLGIFWLLALTALQFARLLYGFRS